MCGRFRLKPDATVAALLGAVRVSGALRYADDIAPCSLISLIRQTPAERRIDTALWWLLLDQATLKPSPATSFNSRSDRLDDKSGKTYALYRSSRCLIPATAFIESQTELVPVAAPATPALFPEDVLESPKVTRQAHHMIELEGSAIAFGGLYKEYVERRSGQVVLAASIITLPPLAAWATIHARSMPLMIDHTNQSVVDQWLDPDFTAVESFAPLLVPRVGRRQRLTPIGQVSRWNPIGPGFGIAPP